MNKNANKIIVIGSPGSGKSTMVRAMNEGVNLPVLHLDKIYHIDNDTHITREELVDKVYEFASEHNSWIIDGNYISTVETRVKLANKIILLNIDAETCLQNIHKRSVSEQQTDMAKGFDISQMKPEFVDFVGSFNTVAMPRIMSVLESYKNEKEIIILKNYNEIDEFVREFRQNNLAI